MTLRIAWSVVSNLISLGVMILILELGQQRGQGLIVTALALIYVSVLSTYSQLDRAQAESSGRSIAHFARILKLLDDPEREPYEVMVEDARKHLEWTGVVFNINVVALKIGWIVTFFYLIRSLWSA